MLDRPVVLTPEIIGGSQVHIYLQRERIELEGSLVIPDGFFKAPHERQIGPESLIGRDEIRIQSKCFSKFTFGAIPIVIVVDLDQTER